MKTTELLSACANFVDNIPENLNYIMPSELKSVLEKSPKSIFLLDVRSRAAYEKAHIEGAINICLKELFEDENLEKIPLDKPIIVCCGIGHVASQILTLLQLLGYNAIGLKYGMGVPAVAGEVQKGWVELDYPVNSSVQCE